MGECAGTLYALQQRIITKLRVMGATSREKAATAKEAHLDMQEQNWLHYIAGGFASRVKKTRDKRYYVLPYNLT